MSGSVERALQRTSAYLSAGDRAPPVRWVLLLALACTLAFLVLMNMELSPYDESLVLQGAVEVGHGQVPHRDFFWTYGPVQLWIVSAMFAIFGKAVIVARLYDLAVRGGILLALGLVAGRLGLRTGLVLGTMLVEAVLIHASGSYLYPVFPSLLCALAATLLLVDPRPGPETAALRLVPAGMLTGATALIRYDIGFFLLAAHILAIALFCLVPRRRPALLARQIALYGAGVALIFLPVAAAAAWTGALPGFVHDIVRFAPANYARMRSLPWPVPGISVGALIALICYVPFLALIPGAAWLGAGGARPGGAAGIAPDRKLAAALLLLVAFFALKGVVRVSLVHSLLAVIPAIPLLVFLLARGRGRATRLPALVVLALALATIALDALVVMRAEARRGFDDLLAARIAGVVPSAMRGSRCSTLPVLGLGTTDGDTYRAACYITAHTRPGERIFVGAGRHDKVFANNVALYVLSDRRPATRWYHLEPGLQTQASVQREIIRDLETGGVRLVALDDRFDATIEPNDSARSSGVHALDDFIARRYARVAAFGSVAIYTRR